MRQRNLPFDVIYYDNWAEEATTKEFIEDLWYKYHARLTLGTPQPVTGRSGLTSAAGKRQRLRRST